MELIDSIRLPTAICLVAAIILAVYFPRLTKPERWIVFLVILTAAVDLFASIVGSRGISNAPIYNASAPVSKMITLGIYIGTTQAIAMRKYYTIGMACVILLAAWGFIKEGVTDHLHSDVYIISGFVISILSYLYMRQFILHRSNPFTSLFWFSFANLLEYTLMVSSISASFAAVTIDQKFAQQIFIGNDIAYILWSCIITFGIIWNQKKT